MLNKLALDITNSWILSLNFRLGLDIITEDKICFCLWLPLLQYDGTKSISCNYLYSLNL